MVFEDALKLVKNCADRMNTMYGKVVFDEWVVLSVSEDKQGKILSYCGPRKDDFVKNFGADLGELRHKLFGHEYHAGDFEFARYGSGTAFEAFMVIGEGVYLFCNNTNETMDGISKDARWLNAQLPFLELAEKFQKNPVIDWS